jgi:2-alkyl-3-oxoalkanoate reductase
VTILVTGGGGFLGKAIIEQLLERGDSVRSFSRGEYPNLRAMGVDVRQGDLADKAAVFGAVEGCDAVFHVAAKPGFWGAYEGYYAANVTGTQNVIDACREYGVSRLVYTSSPSAVDPGSDIEGSDESLPYPEKPVSHYAATKAEGERRALAANGSQLAVTAIRPPLMWGPGDNQLVPRILERAKSGRLPRIGSDAYLVDTTYIENAAEAHLLALDRLAPGSPIAGKVYFISNGEPIPIHEMIDRIVQTAGYSPRRFTLPVWLAQSVGAVVEGVYRVLNLREEPPISRFLVQQFTKSRWFDISAARRDLGYIPRVSISEGLERSRAAWQN